MGCVFVLGLSGCATAAPRVAPEALMVRTEEDVVTVAFRDNLGWPFQLSRLEVAIDGEVVHREAFEPGRLDRPTRLADRVLDAGEHLVEVQAVASYVATRADEHECEVALRAERAFVMRPGGAALIDLNLHTGGGVTTSFPERVALQVGFHGQAVETEVRGRGLGIVGDRLAGSRLAQCRDDLPLAELPSLSGL